MSCSELNNEYKFLAHTELLIKYNNNYLESKANKFNQSFNTENFKLIMEPLLMTNGRKKILILHLKLLNIIIKE